MIPAFPEFKKLELSDKEDIESLICHLPVYSDFDFASMWAWNVKDSMEVAQLHGNVVLRFIDYLSGEPFLTFIGDSELTQTAREVILFSEQQSCGSTLHLIPHEVIQDLNPEEFDIEESRDHFDYILSLDRYITYSGGDLKSRRNFLNNFQKHYPHYSAIELNLSDPETRKKVTELYTNWQEQKGFLSLSEAFAYDRFLHASEHFEYMALGLFVDEKLIAFHVSVLIPGEYANGLFEKADTKFVGVYQALMHEVAKALLAKGKKYLNYEQDLGLESLRRAKLAFSPVHFHKKYSISRKK